MFPSFLRGRAVTLQFCNLSLWLCFLVPSLLFWDLGILLYWLLYSFAVFCLSFPLIFSLSLNTWLLAPSLQPMKVLVSLILRKVSSQSPLLGPVCPCVLVFFPSHRSFISYFCSLFSPLLFLIKPPKQLFPRPLVTSDFRLKRTHGIQHLSLQHWIPCSIIFIWNFLLP